jgi:predicted  nucleic acid-binding Zn-ribbon protein
MNLALRKAQEDCTESYLLTEGLKLERELNAANEMFRKLNIHALNLADRIQRLKEDLMDEKNKHAALVADVALYEDRGERIKRLEDIISRAAYAFFRDGSDGQVASGMLTILEEVRKL